MCSVHSNFTYTVQALHKSMAAFAFMLPSTCRNNTSRGESTQVAGCAMLGAGRQEVVPLKSQVREKYTVHSPSTLWVGLHGSRCQSKTPPHFVGG